MDEPTKKSSSLLTGFRQTLINKLAGVPKVADDGSNAEEVKQHRLSILQDFEEKASSAREIFSQLRVDLKASKDFSRGNPRKPASLLVSAESWPFEDLSELSARFGPLPPGYCYRYLAPESRVVPKSVANNANNVICIPSPLNLVLDKDFDQPGDEIPDRSLRDWLEGQPAELSRVWTFRMLCLLGVIRQEEIPDTVPDATSGTAGSAGEIDFHTDGNVPELIDTFVSCTLLQYNGEEKENDVDALGGVYDKKMVFNTLTKIGPEAVNALIPLLEHPEVAVRVSAATYLLPSAKDAALSVLGDVIAMSPQKRKKKHAAGARRHAILAAWMYQDGKL